MREKLDQMEKQINNCKNCSQSEHDFIELMRDSYKEAISLIYKARYKAYYTAANNMQYYLNGEGGTKIETLDYLRNFGAFNNADTRLNSYIQNLVEAKAESMKSGEKAVFRTEVWDAEVSPWPLNELYYSSGTSLLKGRAVVSIIKSDNSFTADVTVYKTWMDTYDWHKGLGVDRMVSNIGDEGYFELQNVGAKDFEIRAYYTSSMRYEVGPVAKHAVRMPIYFVNEPRWGSPKNYTSEKTPSHPDRTVAGDASTNTY